MVCVQNMRASDGPYWQENNQYENGVQNNSPQQPASIWNDLGTELPEVKNLNSPYKEYTQKLPKEALEIMEAAPSGIGTAVSLNHICEGEITTERIITVGTAVMPVKVARPVALSKNIASTVAAGMEYNESKIPDTTIKNAEKIPFTERFWDAFYSPGCFNPMNIIH